MTDRDRPYRPRTTYEIKDHLQRIATTLNGQERGVGEFHEALEIVLRYIDVLEDEMTCLDCGTKLAPFQPSGRSIKGKYRCPNCHEHPE